MLVQCGAHLHEDPMILGENICLASAMGNVKRLQAFILAGADLTKSIKLNDSVTNVLEQALLYNKTGVLEFLAKLGITNETFCQKINTQ